MFPVHAFFLISEVSVLTDLSNPAHAFLLATKKPRRERTRFTRQQRAELERAFQVGRYANLVLREELAKRLSLSVDVILIWFKNKRAAEARSKRPK